ncbi:MAG TPA: efflux RND transporter periplasmic adaptor subunit [Vicinamibacterales bacterium]|nr:efflux RND transporter periplasmic adaptor subunit [Vicinamibacterales bacterium]
MKKLIFVVIAAAALAGVLYYSGYFTKDTAEAASTTGQGQGPQGRGGQAGGGQGRGNAGGRGNNQRQPMVVELATAHKASIQQQVTVVGNLIGEATVSVVPRTAGRLQTISVKLGDRVTRGQKIAQLEDYDIQEQVKQAAAAAEVSTAQIRQRDADLKRADTNLARSKSLFDRQLLPRQTLDDNEATYQAALAQLDLARAQSAQSQARLEELKITLSNTIITSPVTGFVSKRNVDPGAFVGQQAPIVEVVDVSTVRLVANIVEKDLRQLKPGNSAGVQVDAFPGETFQGRIARISPILDPATRTAPIEIEIPNPASRLRPGMYARVGITVDSKKDTLVVPVNAMVDLGGRRGVFTPLPDNTAAFRVVQVGLENGDVTEVLGGLQEGDRVITTGAASLRDGDRIQLAGGRGGGRRGQSTADANNASNTGGGSRRGQSATQ